MTPQESSQARILATRTFERFEQIAPGLMEKLEKYNGDPSLLQKTTKDLQKWRIRLFPKAGHKQPRGFWHHKWCFYEIAVGSIGSPIPRNAVAQIQFFQTPATARKAYVADIQTIISDAAKKHPEFTARLGNGERAKSFNFLWLTYYSDFQPEKAAKDLACLIESTMDRFQAIAPH